MRRSNRVAAAACGCPARRGACAVLGVTALLCLSNALADDATLTAALLDRLLHHARIVPIAGESYRLKHQCAAGMIKPKREKLLPA